MVRDCPLPSTAGYLLLQGLKATLFELQFMLQVDHLSLQLVDLNGRRPHRRRGQRGMWRCRLGRGAQKPLTILLLPKRPPASLGHLRSQHPPFTSAVWESASQGVSLSVLPGSLYTRETGRNQTLTGIVRPPHCFAMGSFLQDPISPLLACCDEWG